jgi:hypothetical protein
MLFGGIEKHRFSAGWLKNCPTFQKVAQTVSKAKIFTPKLNLKVQNIYIKLHLNPQDTYNKPSFETDYLGEIEINLPKQKEAQNVTIFRATSSFQSIIMSLQK